MKNKHVLKLQKQTLTLYVTEELGHVIVDVNISNPGDHEYDEIIKQWMNPIIDGYTIGKRVVFFRNKQLGQLVCVPLNPDTAI